MRSIREDYSAQSAYLADFVGLRGASADDTEDFATMARFAPAGIGRIRQVLKDESIAKVLNLE
jgi:hypothetical protein